MAGRVAVVGCGHWGKNLVRNFAELGALAAVVDPSDSVAREMSAQFGAPALSFEGALASSDVDAVAIAAPAELHARLAVAAFEAGKHVFVEKPIALTEAEGDSMLAAADRAGKRLMVGHLLQYHPAFVALLDLVRGGGLGPLRYAYSNRLSLGKFRVEENALWSFAPHDVSMLLALFDAEPVTVTGGGGAFVTPGVEDFNRLDMTFADGGKAHVFASWLHPFKEHRLVVVGSEAMAVFEDSLSGPDKLRLFRHRVDTSGREPAPHKAGAESVPFEAGEPLRNECSHFLTCVRDDVRPRTDGREAMRVLRTLLRADPSAFERAA